MRSLWLVVLMIGCAADGPTSSGADAALVDAAAECGLGTPDKLGTDCVSFGAGEPCGGCLPSYGYVCTGGRPDLAGCVQARPESALGTTYCCTDLRCVRAPALDKQCSTGSMWQCPEDNSGKLLAEPAAGCSKSAVPPPYQWFCCP